MLVVTSKAVSKVEGRLDRRSTPPTRTRARRARQRGDRRRDRAGRRQRGARCASCETRHGLVLAAAGVDASNVARNETRAAAGRSRTRSAQLLRERAARTLGVDVGVIISDSMGRPWRAGITDAAIGVAGLTARHRPARARRRLRQHPRSSPRSRSPTSSPPPRDLVKGKLRRRPGRDRARPRARRQARRRRPRQPRADPRRRTTTCSGSAPPRRSRSAARTSAGRPTSRPPCTPTPSQVVTVDDRRRIRSRCGRRSWASSPPAPTRCGARACPATSPRARWCVDPSRAAVLLTLHPRVGQWLQVGGHCEPGDRTVLDAAAREAREESGIGSLSFDPTPLEPRRAPDHLLARRPDPALRRAVPRGRARRRRTGAQRRVPRPAVVPLGRLPDGISPELPELVEAARPRLGCGMSADVLSALRRVAGADAAAARRRAGRRARARTARSSAAFRSPRSRSRSPRWPSSWRSRRARSARRTRPTRRCFPARRCGTCSRTRPACAPERPMRSFPPASGGSTRTSASSCAAHWSSAPPTCRSRPISTRRLSARSRLRRTALPGSPARDGGLDRRRPGPRGARTARADRAARPDDPGRRDDRPVPRAARRAARLRRPGSERLGARLRDPRSQVAALDGRGATRRGRTATSARAARCSGSTRRPASGWSPWPTGLRRRGRHRPGPPSPTPY